MSHLLAGMHKDVILHNQAGYEEYCGKPVLFPKDYADTEQGDFLNQLEPNAPDLDNRIARYRFMGGYFIPYLEYRAFDKKDLAFRHLDNVWLRLQEFLKASKMPRMASYANLFKTDKKWLASFSPEVLCRELKANFACFNGMALENPNDLVAAIDRRGATSESIAADMIPGVGKRLTSDGKVKCVISLFALLSWMSRSTAHVVSVGKPTLATHKQYTAVHIAVNHFCQMLDDKLFDGELIKVSDFVYVLDEIRSEVQKTISVSKNKSFTSNDALEFNKADKAMKALKAFDSTAFGFDNVLYRRIPESSSIYRELELLNVCAKRCLCFPASIAPEQAIVEKHAYEEQKKKASNAVTGIKKGTGLDLTIMKLFKEMTEFFEFTIAAEVLVPEVYDRLKLRFKNAEEPVPTIIGMNAPKKTAIKR